jgi:hypothetical protein
MYLAIVTKASNRVLPNDIYNETHHIIPRCLYKKSSEAGWLDGSPEFKEKDLLVMLFLNKTTESLGKFLAN